MTGRIRTVMIREDPLKRLGALVSSARRAVRDEKGRSLNRSAAALQVPISRQVLINIEDGKPLPSSTDEEPRSATDEIYAVIEVFFGWSPGSIVRYLRENGPEPKRAEVRREDLLDLGGESLSEDELDEADVIGGYVAQWYRAAPASSRGHARKLVYDFVKAHPNGGVEPG